MKTLVIYFSHIGENYMENGIENISKGNTEIVVDKIKEIMDVDVFRVIESKPYSNNYDECCIEAKIELNDDARPQIKEKINNIEKYDSIIIAGPIWWNHYPMPLFSTLENLDFTNKKVKFIVTHEGSGIGSCDKDIKKLCRKAKIYSGLAIRGCKVNLCDNELKKYLELE